MNDFVIVKCSKICRDVKLKKLVNILNKRAEIGKVRQTDALEFAIEKAIEFLKNEK